MDKRGRGQRHLNHRSRPPEVGVPQTNTPEVGLPQTKGPGCASDKWARPRWVYLGQMRLRWGVPWTNEGGGT